MNSSNLAPIALFAYNRVDHLIRTIETLKKNTLAKESSLYVFSDGPKRETDQDSVLEVRKYLKNITGFKSIEIIEASKNKGLANSIIDGITRITDEHGKVIVLEDDIITSSQFLTFMNDALNRYETDERVMHISGYTFPIKISSTDPETFFIKPTTCWGWATWKRAWIKFDRNVDEMIHKFTPEMIQDFDLNKTTPYFKQLLQNQSGELNTWAIFWYASVFLSNGLSLHPRKSYCLNIGHDGSGEHCSPSGDYFVDLNESRTSQFENKIEESIIFRKRIERFFIKLKPSFFTRLKTFLNNRLIAFSKK